MKKLLSTLLAACMLLSVASCSNSGAANRETTVAVTGDTMTTVNPDISEPNQSIPSDAMITETETESTAPVKNGNTYTINGVEFTISVRIEDYLYDLPGSDAKYIDLDKFMETYGFKSEGKWPEERCFYKNADGIGVNFDRKDSSVYVNGLCVCTYADFAFPNGSSLEGEISHITMSKDYPLDEKNHVYVVNGYIENEKLYAKYCISQEMLIVFAVALDSLNETGSTTDAVDSLARALQCDTEGVGVKVIRIL